MCCEKPAAADTLTSFFVEDHHDHEQDGVLYVQV
jgi:hypothetical protein